jgi:hypothetical protein
MGIYGVLVTTEGRLKKQNEAFSNADPNTSPSIAMGHSFLKYSTSRGTPQ